MLISHRGNGLHKYAENTKEAIFSVLNEAVDGVEFDVRLTLDNKLIISHDPIINGNIIRLTPLKILKKHANVSTLNEILKKIKTNKIILIDIKSELDDHIKICNLLNNILKKYNLNIYICSFNKKIIDNLIGKVGLLIGYYINKKYLYNNYYFNIVHYNYKDLIDSKKETFIWTINDKNKAILIDSNKYIITDKYYLIK
ncbi:MAG: glycerophosphodiester phosphodiesterase [Clostridium sp.]|nr:glycerophosphodiester phosphodiesterase [Clostridium sp.]MCM1444158.1 glycerophosphodiester phosphodiesterase [Candidatus Amulumruptor caecigallinarius]